MLGNARGGTIKIGTTDMDYISFGKGRTALIMLPGLGDALKTVRGSAVPLAMMYRVFATDYTVYIFSRKNNLAPGYTTKDMARDQAQAMKALHIEKAYVMGISQGGMIAQHLAIDYPDLVKKLILAVTTSRQNAAMQQVVNHWLELANANHFKELFVDTAENSYSEKRLRVYRPFYGILSRISKPKSLERFIIQASACLQHNAYDELSRIQCPTLVLGGDCDRIVGKAASSEISERIADSQLILHEGLGHAAYEEAPEFNRQVLDFLAL